MTSIGCRSPRERSARGVARDPARELRGLAAEEHLVQRSQDRRAALRQAVDDHAVAIHERLRHEVLQRRVRVEGPLERTHALIPAHLVREAPRLEAVEDQRRVAACAVPLGPFELAIPRPLRRGLEAEAGAPVEENDGAERAGPVGAYQVAGERGRCRDAGAGGGRPRDVDRAGHATAARHREDERRYDERRPSPPAHVSAPSSRRRVSARSNASTQKSMSLSVIAALSHVSEEPRLVSTPWFSMAR